MARPSFRTFLVKKCKKNPQKIKQGRRPKTHDMDWKSTLKRERKKIFFHEQKKLILFEKFDTQVRNLLKSFEYFK